MLLNSKFFPNSVVHPCSSLAHTCDVQRLRAILFGVFGPFDGWLGQKTPLNDLRKLLTVCHCARIQTVFIVLWLSVTNMSAVIKQGACMGQCSNTYGVCTHFTTSADVYCLWSPKVGKFFGELKKLPRQRCCISVATV